MNIICYVKYGSSQDREILFETFFVSVIVITTHMKVINCSLQHCDVRLERCNLRIRWVELREARSHGNTKYTVTLSFVGAFGDVFMVMTF
jgi:hypothetical protein